MTPKTAVQPALPQFQPGANLPPGHAIDQCLIHVSAMASAVGLRWLNGALSLRLALWNGDHAIDLLLDGMKIAQQFFLGVGATHCHEHSPIVACKGSRSPWITMAWAAEKFVQYAIQKARNDANVPVMTDAPLMLSVSGARGIVGVP